MMIPTKTNPAPGYKAFAIWILAVAAFAVAALTALALADPAQSAGPAKTKLTIKAEGVDLSGTVKSTKLRCVANRNIKLYKQLGSRQNPKADSLIATDTSERQGNRGVWSTGNTGMSGKFYVRTGKVPGCTAAASKTIRAVR
jgi:hypothetical protein